MTDIKTRVSIDRAVQIPGWMSEPELRWLAEQATHARVIVEVGCWQGRSTRALADHCPGHVLAIDRWGPPIHYEDGRPHELNTDVFAQFYEHLADHLASGTVIPVPKAFAEVAPTLPAGSVDFCFIDGDHRYAAMRHDIEAAVRLVRPGGVIAGHDYLNSVWPGVRKAVDERFGTPDTIDNIWYVVQS